MKRFCAIVVFLFAAAGCGQPEVARLHGGGSIVRLSHDEQVGG